MSRKDIGDAVFKALSDPKRREILDLLKDRPRTTGELCQAFKKWDRCTIMLHLRILEEADLVIAKREGRFRWNYLNIVPIQNIYDRWINKYAVPSAKLLTRLKAGLEE